jgi:hypothetical protein
MCSLSQVVSAADITRVTSGRNYTIIKSVFSRYAIIISFTLISRVRLFTASSFISSISPSSSPSPPLSSPSSSPTSPSESSGALLPLSHPIPSLSLPSNPSSLVIVP